MSPHARVLAIIPARGGSKRIPNKNLKVLDGKSLVKRALDNAVNANLVDTVILSSDDTNILAEADHYKGVIKIKRPSEIAQDRSKSIEFVQHTLNTLVSLGHAEYDIIVIVQPTSPLTIPSDVDDTIELLIASDADSVVTVMKLDHAIHPLKLKVLRKNLLLPYLEAEDGRMAEHEMPPLYIRNGSVYASKRHVFNAGKIIGNVCYGCVMPRERSIDINDEIDILFAEFLLKRNDI